MKRFHHILTIVIIACMAVAFGACSMMEDDRSDCPTGLYVRFVYDYNTQRADMFKDHVGYVTVYVYDESGKKVAEKSVANTIATMPLANYGYTMHFTENELPAGHRYRLQAVAMQKDWDDALNTPGAKYRCTTPADTSSLTITLDHEATTISDASQLGKGLHAVNNSAPLDTLWHTLKVMPDTPTYGYNTPAIAKTTKPYSIYPMDEQMVSVQPGYATYATISLIRDTKHLNITLRQIDNPEAINADDYEVTIVDANSTLASDNSVLPGDSLLYTPYAQWTTRYEDNEGTSIEGDIHPATRSSFINRTAHYNLMFNRLMYDKDSEKCAKLRIRNKQTGKTVALVNLPSILAEGRIAYEWQNYSPQEYLDREYDYELDFFLLSGDEWKYLDIHIHVLAWTLRKQNVVLD